MKKNKCLFSFGKLNKYFIIPFLCPIFCFLANYLLKLYISVHNLVIKVENGENDNNIMKKAYLISCSISFSYLGGGLLYFISYIRTNTEKSKKSSGNINNNTVSASSISSNSSSIEYIYNEPFIKINSFKIICILFAFSLFLFLDMSCGLIIINELDFEKRFYFLIFLPIFSRIILKNELLRHQILSLFISFIGLILLFIALIIKNKEIPIVINILTCISSAGYSFFFVLIKQITYKYFISPYICLLYIGFFLLIISLI